MKKPLPRVFVYRSRAINGSVMVRVLFGDVRPSTCERVERHLRNLGAVRVARIHSSKRPLDFNLDRLVFDADEDRRLENVETLRAHPTAYAAPAFALMTLLPTRLAVRLAKIGAVPMGECHNNNDARELARAVYDGAVAPLIAIPRSLAKIAAPANDLDEEMISKALEQNNGCVARAAKTIGVPPDTPVPHVEVRSSRTSARVRAR